jgi:hypothetical protein
MKEMKEMKEMKGLKRMKALERRYHCRPWRRQKARAMRNEE